MNKRGNLNEEFNMRQHYYMGKVCDDDASISDLFQEYFMFKYDTMRIKLESQLDPEFRGDRLFSPLLFRDDPGAIFLVENIQSKLTKQVQEGVQKLQKYPDPRVCDDISQF